MMIDLRGIVDRVADAIVPIRDSLPVDGSAADRLAQTEEDTEVFEPLGEHPEIPPIVAVGVEPPSPTAPPAATLLHRHQLTASALAGYPYACLCGQAFRTRGGHTEHVVDLAESTDTT